MDHAPQIIAAIRASAVNQILVVDDAYDAPAFSDEWAGALLELVESPILATALTQQQLPERQREEARQALLDGEFDSDAIESLLEPLYAAYLLNRSTELDPGSQFARIKGAALDALDPLILLLGQCGPDVHVTLAGRNDALEKYAQIQPDMILMDFYLSPQLAEPRAENANTNRSDRERSIKLLRSMLENTPGHAPAVVLMSSQDIEAKADNYRARLDDRVMALRFGFLRKAWITREGAAAQANGDAADVLIDTSASLAFGRSIEAALADWRKGAEEAIAQLRADLRSFELRDFAYLMRFRLYDEGEPFADYLEWFLGESLRALVDQNVAWESEHFQEINRRELTDAIEGADLIPSQRIAHFFHRMRFNDHRSRPRSRYALGDVFLSKDRKKARMVISPDCDLVPRNGKQAARRLLSVGGVIRGLEQDGAYAAELIWLGSPKGISWSLKDLMSHVPGDISKLTGGDEDYDFFARLNPLPAQAVQKQALADLSRVGVAVPPTVHASAPVTTFIKLQDENQERLVEIGGLASPRAQVLMPRGGRDATKRLLFTPAFVRTLFAHLTGLEPDKVANSARPELAAVLAAREPLETMLKRTGFPIPWKHDELMIAAAIGKPVKGAWLQFVCDLSDGALIDQESEDPLA